MTAEQLITQHWQWLTDHIHLIWLSLIGGAVRLLLVSHEPLSKRLQNAAAGCLLGITLTDVTADLLTGGRFGHGYAVLYGLVGRELVLILRQLLTRDAYRLIRQLISATARLKLSIAPDDEDPK